MVFSSVSFLYYFLPITLLLYLFVPNKFKNYILLLASIVFYMCGEPRYVLILIFSCVFNYLLGLFLSRTVSNKKKKCLMIFGIVIDFLILFYFKYLNFFVDNINKIFGAGIGLYVYAMPIGISFFTFQAASYVIDVYNDKVKATKSLLVFSTYLTMFPQLIAGPIVRYETIEEQMRADKSIIDYSKFALGIKRFIIGLSKKVILANVLGGFSKELLSLKNKTVLSHLLVSVSDTLQLYFDFSGYSDMAIGIGLILGFEFLENFNYPLIARSITDFWRRWHISLSTWFRDYLYIPLGGNRKGKYRTYLNIFIVWMLTGFWHGANWNFIIWGLYFAVILILEKMFLLKILSKSKVLSHIYSIVLIVIGFVIFNQTSLTNLGLFLKNMLGFGGLPFLNLETIFYFKNYLVIIIISVFLATPVLKSLIEKLKMKEKYRDLYDIIEIVICFILLIVCTSYIINESYNPFLYFRF